MYYVVRSEFELLLLCDLLEFAVICVQEESTVEDVCKQIIKQWEECCSKSAAKKDADDGIVWLWFIPNTIFIVLDSELLSWE